MKKLAMLVSVLMLVALVAGVAGAREQWKPESAQNVMKFKDNDSKALAYTINPSQPYKLRKLVLICNDSASGSDLATLTMDSIDGTDFDGITYSKDMSGLKTHVYVFPDHDYISPGTTYAFAYGNTDNDSCGSWTKIEVQ